MVEYLYDAIKAVAGQSITVNAWITDEDENVITSDCSFMLHDENGDKLLATVDGIYLPENLMMEFTLPAEATQGLKGKYWYCIQHANSNLCFMQPIYLV